MIWKDQLADGTLLVLNLGLAVEDLRWALDHPELRSP